MFFRRNQSESPAAAALKSIVTTLKIGKPPSNIPVNVMFEKINSRLTEVLQKCGKYTTISSETFHHRHIRSIIHLGPSHLGQPLFNPDKPLKAKQWERLELLRNELDNEYDLRRQMLITRLDVTIQSFQV